VFTFLAIAKNTHLVTRLINLARKAAEGVVQSLGSVAYFVILFDTCAIYHTSRLSVPLVTKQSSELPFHTTDTVSITSIPHVCNGARFNSPSQHLNILCGKNAA
jgi:hypothetical protein